MHALWTFNSKLLLFFISDCLLRNHGGPLGPERSPDQGPGDDVHPVPLLQVDGRRRPVPAPGVGHAAACQRVPKQHPRTVILKAMGPDIL